MLKNRQLENLLHSKQLFGLLKTLIFAAMILPGFAQAVDFATRCADPNVVRCVGFDEPDIIANNRHPDRGADNITFDSSVKASGAGSMRFLIPSNSGETDGSGSWRINFSDSPFNVQFGENEEFYVQWRQRFEDYYLNHVYEGAGGWKQIILSQGDVVGVQANACTELEMVVANGKNWKLPQAYHSCWVYLPFQKYDSTVDDYLIQNAAGCRWRNGTPTIYDGECVPYYAGEFMTFQVHLKLGPWVENIPNPIHSNTLTNGFYPSTFELWVARDGEPSVLTVKFDNFVIRRGNYKDSPGDASETAKYGKVWLTTYNTGKSDAETHVPSFTWYDELIISRSKIPEPDASVSGGSKKPPLAPVNPRIDIR